MHLPVSSDKGTDHIIYDRGGNVVHSKNNAKIIHAKQLVAKKFSLKKKLPLLPPSLKNDKNQMVHP